MRQSPSIHALSRRSTRLFVPSLLQCLRGSSLRFSLGANHEQFPDASLPNHFLLEAALFAHKLDNLCHCFWMLQQPAIRGRMHKPTRLFCGCWLQLAPEIAPRFSSDAIGAAGRHGHAARSIPARFGSLHVTSHCRYVGRKAPGRIRGPSLSQLR